MRHLSLFSGIGGFDLAFEQAKSAKTIAFCENNAHCQQLLAQKWPQTPIFDDIGEIIGNEFAKIDIITGGFPCQDISIAGNRTGLAGNRSGLFWEFVRIVEKANPEWFILENVAGLLSSGGRRDLGAIIGTMVQLGYGVSYRVLDSQYFGVPQRRRRVFIVGHSGGDCRRAAEVLFEPESLSRTPEPRRKTRTRLAEDSEDSLGASGITNALTARYGGSGGIGDVNDAQGELLIPVGTHEQNISGSIGGNATGGHRLDLDNAGAYVVRMREGKPGGGKGALVSEDTSLTLATGNDQVLFTADAVRKLTPTECERLQGFPDGWTVGFPDSIRYRMLGNAVCVPVVRWIASRMISL